MKTVLFVPGVGESLETNDYASLMQAIEARGFAVRFVPIQWKDTTVEDWLCELEEVYASYNPSETILAGHSAGAMTAFISATRRNPSELWLFSLSPYFAEDLESPLMWPSWLKSIGQRRMDSCKRLHFNELADAITCSVLLLGGEAELADWPLMEDRLTKAHRQLKNSRLVIAKDAHHDVTSESYIAAIKAAI